MQSKDEDLAHKISDLTESLTRTTDVLSSADRMIDHYRDLNNEHEHVIARLQGDLQKRKNSQRKKSRNSINKSLSPTERYFEDDSEISSSDGEYEKSVKRKSTGTVRFTSTSKDDKLELLESSIIGINQRQSALEEVYQQQRALAEHFRRDKNKERDLNRMDLTLQKELLSTKEDDNRSQTILEERLRILQEKIDHDHELWKTQQNEMKNITYEMKSLKQVVKETVTPKKSDRRKSKATPKEQDTERELFVYRNKSSADEKKIMLLEDELLKNIQEKSVYQNTAQEIQAIGDMKSNQLKLLEDQLMQEKQERNQFQERFYAIKNRADELETDKMGLLNQLSEVKAEVTAKDVALEKSNENIPQLKMLLQRSERQRDKLSEYIYKLKEELESKDSQLEFLSHQTQDQKKKISSIDSEKSSLLSQAELNANRYFELRKDLESLSALLKDTDVKLKESEKNRLQLKDKAVDILREYRAKCRKYEHQLEEQNDNHKMKTAQLTRELSHSKQTEIEHLKLQKEDRELRIELQNTKQELHDRQNKLTSLLEEKNHAEQALSVATNNSIQITELKKDNQELSNEKSNLHYQLVEEVRKRHELETLLHQTYEKREGNEKSVQKEVKHFEDKIRVLEGEKNEHIHEMKKVQSLYDDMKRSIARFDDEKKEDKLKETQLSQKLKKFSDENIRIKKQYRTMKQSLQHKIESLQQNIDSIKTTASSEKQQTNTLQNQNRECQTENEKLRRVVKIVFSITMCDVENLLHLLTREDETLPPLKEIPVDLLSVEYTEKINELRKNFQSCYSISNTLKQRFKQQKTLIKKAQERMRKQMQDFGDYKAEHTTNNAETKRTCDELERSCKEREESIVVYKRKISTLQDHVKTLTKHLEECTKALQTSLTTEVDRKKVLREIEQLRNEHMEKERLDENFYRQTEKVNVLTNQLTDAKKSLSEIKQDQFDSTIFTNRVIESFSSVSPKRKRHFQDSASPRRGGESSQTFLETFQLPSYVNELNTTPKHVVMATRDIDPMSMTDEEFDTMFLPRKSFSKLAKKEERIKHRRKSSSKIVEEN